MTTPNQIILDKVNLHYASVAFKERSLKALMSKLLKKTNQTNIGDIHALKEVSIHIRKGDRVGLIGHNGAGKSTFLKTIAGLYPISSGQLKVQGEIRSLFDLSLGFEPDASGRENILYRGLLLGLTPRQIREKTKEIIAFADLGEFIEYPIKTYSAGMQVRLAFAISTMVGGDILLLDEVIGAGDSNFMKKAKKRIMNLIEQSDILVLASHDTATLQDICNRGLVFNHGEVCFDGSIDEALQQYRLINDSRAPGI